MKFTISRDEIHEALQKVVSVIPQRSTIAMTQNILLTAADGIITLTATDLEITINSWAEGNIHEEGSVAIPGKLINDTIRELPTVDLTFESDANFRLFFHSEIGEYRIIGENPAGFFQKPQLEDAREIILDNETLKRLIENTIFACSTDELRPALTGVFFECGEGRIRSVATDGHRLATMAFSDTGLPEELISAIISTRALNFVMRNLAHEGSTNIKFGKNHALFQMNNTQLYARLINEVYVDYNKVIPKETNYNLSVDAQQFHSSVRRVSLFSNPLSSQVVLKISPDSIELQAKDQDFGGEAKEKITAEFTGDEFLIGFNSKYLQDVLRHIDSDQVVMQFIRPDYAVLARPGDLPENEEQLMLLMPIRLDSI